MAFPCAQAHVSLESSCPRAPRCFPDLHYRGSRGRNKPLFPSEARNCVNGHAHEKQHPWATAAPGMGMLPVSTDIPQLPVPGVCAGLGQAPLLRGFAGNRRVLGSVPPFQASPDLDSLPARAQPPGSALPPLLPAAGRGPAERAGLLLLMPVASAPAERGASLRRRIQPLIACSRLGAIPRREVLTEHPPSRRGGRWGSLCSAEISLPRGSADGPRPASGSACPPPTAVPLLPVGPGHVPPLGLTLGTASVGGRHGEGA